MTPKHVETILEYIFIYRLYISFCYKYFNQDARDKKCQNSKQVRNS